MNSVYICRRLSNCVEIKLTTMILLEKKKLFIVINVSHYSAHGSFSNSEWTMNTYHVTFWEHIKLHPHIHTQKRKKYSNQEAPEENCSSYSAPVTLVFNPPLEEINLWVW